MNLLQRWAARAWLWRRTIRVRLTLWFVAVLALVLLTFCGFLYLSFRRSLEQELDRSLLANAQQIASALELYSTGSALGEMPEGIPSDLLVVVRDAATQRILYQSPGLPLPALSGPMVAQALAGRPVIQVVPVNGPAGPQDSHLAVWPVAENGRVEAWVEVARSSNDLEPALTQLTVLMVIAFPVALLVAAAGGLFLAAQAFGPIDRITHTAARIGAGDLGARLAYRGVDDEVGRLAMTFDAMLDRLERAFERQRRFTADASHELRTPLALLRSQIDVCLEHDRDPLEYRQVLLSLREDVERLGQLQTELLTLARADAGQARLVLESVELDALVADVVLALQPLADERGIRLQLQPSAATTGTIIGDQTRLAQLFLNLLENAIKYTDTGGLVTVTVAITATLATVTVNDSGRGIAPEHLPRVFERFYRADDARTREAGGSGLGLAICRWIVEAHGGTITIESELGRGTTVIVQLPHSRSE